MPEKVIIRESYGGDSDQSEIVSRGGSCIIDPFGSILVGPNFEGEALLVAEINQDDIPRAKYDFDVTGHYARPDVFHCMSMKRIPCQ